MKKISEDIIMNIDSEIKRIFCENFKDKIVVNERFDAFISSFSKNRIENIYKIFAVMESDSSKLAHVFSLSLHPKNVIVDDFKKNYKTIYRSILLNSCEDIIVQLS